MNYDKYCDKKDTLIIICYFIDYDDTEQIQVQVLFSGNFLKICQVAKKGNIFGIFCLLKFIFSIKATKFDEIFTDNLSLCSKCQIECKDFVNFCGLLRKHELQVKKYKSLSNKQPVRFSELQSSQHHFTLQLTDRQLNLQKGWER